MAIDPKLKEKLDKMLGDGKVKAQEKLQQLQSKIQEGYNSLPALPGFASPQTQGKINLGRNKLGSAKPPGLAKTIGGLLKDPLKKGGQITFQDEIGRGFTNFLATNVEGAINLPAAILAPDDPVKNMIRKKNPNYRDFRDDIGDFFKGKSDEAGKFIREIGTEATGIPNSSISGAIGDVTGFLFGVGKLGKVTKAEKAISKLSQVEKSKKYGDLGTKLISLKEVRFPGSRQVASLLDTISDVPKVAAFTTKSALETALGTAFSEGNLPSFDQVRSGLAVDTIFKGLGSFFGKKAVDKYMEAVNVQGGKLQSYMKQEGRAKEALELNFKGNPGQIYEKADKFIRDGIKRGQELSSKIKIEVPGNEFAKPIVAELQKLKDVGDIKNYDEMYRMYKDWLAENGALNTNKLFQIKQYGKEQNKLFIEGNKALSSKDAAKAQFWQILGKEADKMLNNASDQLRNLNLKLNTAYIVRDSVNEAVRNLQGKANLHEEFKRILRTTKKASKYLETGKVFESETLRRLLKFGVVTPKEMVTAARNFGPLVQGAAEKALESFVGISKPIVKGLYNTSVDTIERVKEAYSEGN